MKLLIFYIGGAICLAPIAFALHFGLVEGLIQGVGLVIMGITIEI